MKEKHCQMIYCWVYVVHEVLRKKTVLIDECLSPLGWDAALRLGGMGHT